MAPRFDDARMELSLGVRDLALQGGPGRVPQREWSLPLSRISLGRVASGVHREQARAARRSGLAEVPVRFETRRGGYRILLSGRIDALLEEGRDGLVVQEVKTLFRRAEHLPHALEGAGLEDYRRQVLLYAFLVEQARACPVRCRLLLVSALDRGTVEIPVPYRRSEVDSFLAARLDRIIADHREEVLARDRRREWGRRLGFPHPAVRPHQDEMIRAVTESLEAGRPLLLSAPAGIGKTVGALYPAVRHALEHRLRLFFLTAKNTQARMARETLERIGLAGSPVRALFLRSKERMCATGELVCHEDACPYLRDLGFKLHSTGIREELLHEGIVVPDRVFEHASRSLLCPFYTQLGLAREADVLVGDYNYVFDPVVALEFLFQEGGAGEYVVVVDEVHNLPRRVREAYSPTLARSSLVEARREARVTPDPLFATLADFIGHIEETLDSIGASLESAAEVRPFLPDVERFAALRDELEGILLRLLLSRERPPVPPGEDPILRFFFDFARFVRVLEMEELPKTVFLSRAPPEGIRILSPDPAVVIGERVRRFAGAVLMSATLAPVEFFRRTLGLEDPSVLEVDLPSPFPRDRRAVFLDRRVSTRYRDRAASYGPIATLVEEVAGGRLGNYLCFFPSFAYLREVQARLDAERVELVVQMPSMTEGERDLVLARLAEPPGGRSRVVLGVQGGIFSEGVDYPGELCVGVIVVGPALPALGFDNECIRSYFEGCEGRGFEFAYLFPGINRVIQSAGRLLRTPRDAGVLVLVGERFSRDPYRRCLPHDWIEDAVPIEAGEAGEAVRRFWGGIEGGEE